MKSLFSFPPLSRTEKVVTTFWVLFALCLFFYSFTQIDLGLVISRYPFFYAIEKAFQYIGYFRRDVSTYLYITTMLGGFLIFGYTLFLAGKNHLTKKGLFIIVTLVSLILAFSYNAFSYDLFNYLFDAKILTHYHLNPYEYKALDFPTDPMLGFMHWTHRTYPYGPIWLALTVPLSFIGGNIFIVTFFLFKSLALVCYLVFCYYFYRLVQVYDEKRAVFLTTFLVLNPLFLLEFLVSAHNDSAMFALSIMAVYYLLKKYQGMAYSLLLLSIGVKFATIFLLPAFLLYTIYIIYKKEVPKKLLAFTAMFGMSCAFLLVCYRTTFQPWYLIYILPFLFLFPWKKEVGWVIFAISIVTSGYYVPYLLYGAWSSGTVGSFGYSYMMSIFPITVFVLLIFYFWHLAQVFLSKQYE